MPRWAFGLGALAALALLAKRIDRVTVAGDSMRPTLEAGDRLLVWRSRRLQPGSLVVVPDPRLAERALVKRVAGISPDGTVALRGDNPTASTDSRAFGVVPRASVQGRVIYRYHPPGRAAAL